MRIVYLFISLVILVSNGLSQGKIDAALSQKIALSEADEFIKIRIKFSEKANVSA